MIVGATWGGWSMTEAGATMVRLSKSEIGELALDSALELELAAAGQPFDVDPLHQLASALRQTTGSEEVPGRVAHMRPGYFEPFERLYRVHKAAEPKSFEQIRKFVATSIEQIDAAASRPLEPALASKLVDFCLELDREFARRQPTEDRGGRSTRGIPIEAFRR